MYTNIYIYIYIYIYIDRPAGGLGDRLGAADGLAAVPRAQRPAPCSDEVPNLLCYCIFLFE